MPTEIIDLLRPQTVSLQAGVRIVLECHAMRGRTVRTAKKRQAFLTALAAGNSVAVSALAGGIGRSAAYEWRDADPTFAADWDDAAEQSVDLLEDEARRRALSQSDVLLIFLLKARRPATYREPRGAAAVVAMMTPDDLKAIEEARRIRNMSPEEVEAELAEIERRRAIAEAVRAEADAMPRHRGNGRDHVGET